MTKLMMTKMKRKWSRAVLAPARGRKEREKKRTKLLLQLESSLGNKYERMKTRQCHSHAHLCTHKHIVLYFAVTFTFCRRRCCCVLLFFLSSSPQALCYAKAKAETGRAAGTRMPSNTKEGWRTGRFKSTRSAWHFCFYHIPSFYLSLLFSVFFCCFSYPFSPFSPLHTSRANERRLADSRAH